MIRYKKRMGMQDSISSSGDEGVPSVAKLTINDPPQQQEGLPRQPSPPKVPPQTVEEQRKAAKETADRAAHAAAVQALKVKEERKQEEWEAAKKRKEDKDIDMPQTAATAPPQQVKIEPQTTASASSQPDSGSSPQPSRPPGMPPMMNPGEAVEGATESSEGRGRGQPWTSERSGRLVSQAFSAISGVQPSWAQRSKARAQAVAKHPMGVSRKPQQ